MKQIHKNKEIRKQKQEVVKIADLLEELMKEVYYGCRTNLPDWDRLQEIKDKINNFFKGI